MSASNKGKMRITFQLAAPGAQEVSIAGDFNEWNAKKHSLKKKSGGFWERTLMLFPGRYEYKFLVDGVWRVDPSNSLLCKNTFGTRNSVIEVKARLLDYTEKNQLENALLS